MTTSPRRLAPLLLAGLLAPQLGCGSKDPPKPPAVAQNTPQPPDPVEPPPPPPPTPKVDPPPPPPAEPFRPMGRPDPLPPYEEEPTPGPVVKLPDPPVNPMPPGPGPGPMPPPPPADDPNKKPEFPKFISGRDLGEWLKEATTHPDPQYREAALRVLPRFGPDARSKIILPLCDIIRGVDSDLVKVRETDPGVRIAAITIVSNLGFDFRVDNDKATADEKKKMAELRRQSRQVIGALMAVIAETGPGSFLRMYCTQSLATFGTDAHRAVPQLRMMASDINWATRHAVAQTLGVIGGPADDKDAKTDIKDFGPYEPAADVLLNVSLKDKCAAVRVAAAQSLLRLGPPKPKNPADLAKALEKFVKPVAARVEPATPGGKAAEEDTDVLVWLWLLQLSYDGSKLDANVKKIAEQVSKPKTPGVRLQALFALAALGPAALPAMPAVREVLDRYDDPVVLIAAMEVCASIGTKGGADALPELQAIRNGKHAPKKPDGAPRDWQPDPTLKYAAEDCIAVVTGKRKLPEVKKDPTKDEPEPKK